MSNMLVELDMDDDQILGQLITACTQQVLHYEKVLKYSGDRNKGHLRIVLQAFLCL